MPINKIRQEGQIRQSDTFSDTLSPGITLETLSTDLESDLNSVRSQISRILDNTGGNWYDDIPVVALAQKSLKQLAEALNVLETGANSVRDAFIPTTGQTVFTLSDIAIDLNDVRVFINGQKIKTARDFNISGTTLTITLTYALNNGDDVEVYYIK